MPVSVCLWVQRELSGAEMCLITEASHMITAAVRFCCAGTPRSIGGRGRGGVYCMWWVLWAAVHSRLSIS